MISGRCDANGRGSLKFRTTGRETYTVQQVSHNGSIENAIPVGGSAVCGLFKNGVQVSPTVAAGSVISGDPPVKLRGQDLMELRYRNANANAAIEMIVFYDDGLPG